MIIRPESPADHDAVRSILIAAFADHPHSRQTEHLIVEALRADGALTVGLVAEIDGDVLGHIAFSPVLIGGNDCLWFALGPVAVLPGFQRRGIGSRLVEEGLAAIRGLGAAGCVLVGEPTFYERFGFRNDAKLSMHRVPAQYLLCLPISGEIPAGEVTHHPAFCISK
ncbi:MAG: GNAT family N-acetyltransferase [Planctomycetota bacterium]